MIIAMRSVLFGLIASCVGFCQPASAAGYDRAAIAATFCSEAGRDVPRAVKDILEQTAAVPPEDRAWASRIVQAFTAKALRCAADGAAFIADGASATTLAPAQAPDNLRSPLPSLRSRALLEQVAAALALFSAVRAEERIAAIRVLEQRGDGVPDELLRSALASEPSMAARDALQGLIVGRGLHAPESARRVAAIVALAADPTARIVNQLASLRADAAYAADPLVAATLDGQLARARRIVQIGDALSLLYNGISAGSVLFMTSVGLAIIFGLMGVINLAQGEFIMIGAYTTYCVQEVMRARLPGLFEYYPLMAVPIVFFTTAAIGMAIEATAIRHLYRRPLMTLLATWAIGLLLVNLVRVGFGTQNLQFATPFYLAGGVRVLGDFVVTWNHLAAIAFAALSFIGTFALLRFTDLGLFIRAVTQNRGMAGCVGVSTRRIDLLAFGFGAGLA